jgi:hypothetical protein
MVPIISFGIIGTILVGIFGRLTAGFSLGKKLGTGKSLLRVQQFRGKTDLTWESTRKAYGIYQEG